MAEAALYEALRDGVAAVGGRVYRSQAPQDTDYPAIIYERTSTLRTHAFGRDALPISAEFEVSVYGRRAEGLEAHDAVVAEVVSAINRYSVDPIIDIMIEDQDDDYQDNTEVFEHELDIRVWYTP